jgi:hypothetical protein
LDVGKTNVSAAGLKRLTTLKQLRVLDLRSTRLNDAEIRDLKKVLPPCDIWK